LVPAKLALRRHRPHRRRRLRGPSGAWPRRDEYCQHDQVRRITMPRVARRAFEHHGVHPTGGESMSSDFPGAFNALRDILRRHADGMVVQSDTPTEFVVATRALAPNGRPMWFGCVSLKKTAVT